MPVSEVHPRSAGCRSSTAGQASRTQHAPRQARGERPGPRLCQQMYKVTSVPSAAGRNGVWLCKRLIGKQRRHLRVSRERTRRANLPSRVLNHNTLAGIWLVPSSLQVSAPGSCAAGSGSSALPPGPGCSRIWDCSWITRSTANSDFLQDFQHWPGSPLLPGDELSAYVPQTLDIHPKPLGARLL